MQTRTSLFFHIASNVSLSDTICMLHVFTLIAKHYEDVEKNTTIKTWKLFLWSHKIEFVFVKSIKISRKLFYSCCKVHKHRTEQNIDVHDSYSHL